MLLTVKLYFLFWVFLVNFGPHLHRYLGCVGLLASSAYLLVAVVELHYLCFCQPCFIKLVPETLKQTASVSFHLLHSVDRLFVSRLKNTTKTNVWDKRVNANPHNNQHQNELKHTWRVQFKNSTLQIIDTPPPPPLPSFKVTSRQLKVHGNTIQNWFPEYRWIGWLTREKEIKLKE